MARASNQTLMYSGTTGPVSTTLTNPYDSTLATLSGTYSINNSTYTGTGTGNSLFMSNSTEFITLDSATTGHSPNVQTVVDVQRILTGNGDDVVDMASANFTLPGTVIDLGSGNEIIWANSGDDTISAGSGNDTINAGPGNDTIDAGLKTDAIEGGTGTDTAVFFSPESAYTITRTGPATFTIAGTSNTIVANLSDVEFAQFSDQTLDLSTVPAPEPTALTLLAIPALALSRHRKRN